MLLMITPPPRSRCSQYTVQFPPGRHARPDDGPVTGPKHVVYKSNKHYTTIFSCVQLLLPLHLSMLNWQNVLDIQVHREKFVFMETDWDKSEFHINIQFLPRSIHLNTKIIKYLSSNTSCFVVCEAACFGPYMTIIRPICESS